MENNINTNIESLETVKCRFCSIDISEKDAKYLEYYDDYLCKECYKEEIVECRFCNTDISKADAKYLEHYGDYCCEECYNGEIVECDSCGILVSFDDTTHLEMYGHRVCECCYENYIGVCDGCDHLFYQSDLTYIEHPPMNYDGYYCEYCREFTCDLCGSSVDVYDVTGLNGNIVCQECSDEFEEYEGRIHSHSYKPTPTFKNGKNDNDKFYIGFELEVEVKKNRHKVVERLEEENDIKDLIYFKEDGSLEHGFEIVSHPFTYKWYKENKNILIKMLEILTDKGCLSYDTDTCGMHIHMSKDVIKSIEIYKMIKLVYNESDITYFISQRKKKDELTKYASLERRMDKLVKTCKEKLDFFHDRYQAINITGNTIELRFFKGNLNKNSFFKNLEFAFALKEYVENTAINDVNYKSFYKFVKSKDKKYINLTNFIENSTRLRQRLVEECETVTEK